MRSPFGYPFNRGADMDVGGAADLQTDVMRFMAIISLCLVAIFALVQALPLSPVTPMPLTPTAAETPVAPQKAPAVEPVIESVPEAAPAVLTDTQLPPVSSPTSAPPVTLTRPKWVPKYPSQTAAPIAEPAQITSVEEQGFTLRFESDAVLTRLVAASQVGFYAIEAARARRMTVSESRISFWDASTPKSFHEMEVGTVPAAVVDALARTGANPDNVSWGVTLPGNLKRQLDSLMQAYDGGSLVITSQGHIEREES